jgi:hypothetical protein
MWLMVLTEHPTELWPDDFSLAAYYDYEEVKTMSVVIELPDEVERRLRQQSANWELEAKEAMLIELYRQGKLSHYELSQALGLDRFETDGLLKKHQVSEDLPTAEEIEEGLNYLREVVRR